MSALGLGAAGVGCAGPDAADEKEAVMAVGQAVVSATCVNIKRNELGSVSDTYVNSGQPNTSFGSAPVLAIGAASQALFKFDMSGPGVIPAGSVITKATLRLRVTQGSGNINVHAINVPWAESVTYNQFYAGPGAKYGPSIAPAIPATPLGGKLWDATALAQGWYANPTSNNGILLEQNSFAAISSSEGTTWPLLTVCFFKDVDGDGYTEDVDCDDHDATVHPGGTETCDNLDNNCDGLIDEGLLGTVQNCAACNDTCTTANGTPACVAGACQIATCDAGFGDCNAVAGDGCEKALPCAVGEHCSAATDCSSGVCTNGTCAAPSCSDGVKNGNEVGTDCGGGCAALCPGCFIEICDGIDNDCDGVVDNGSPGTGSACDSGGCGPGTTVCENGAVKCVADSPYLGCTEPPVVTIVSPSYGAIASADSIEVSGTVNKPSTITVGTIVATQNGNSFSVQVPLHEGSNIISVSATDAQNSTGVASVLVLRDTTPPKVNILTPANNALIVGTFTTVVGTVQDLVIGNVDAGDCVVKVNGVDAEVANGAFVALNVPVAKGFGTITAVATDSGGNMASSVITVNGDPSAKAQIVVNSGNAQTAPVATVLPQPLSVLVLDNAGNPVADVPVTFQVTRGNGFFTGGVRNLTILSTSGGIAEVALTLGSKAGQATDLVEATAPSFFGVATFAASATASPDGVRVLQVVEGANQRVGLAALADLPLVAMLLDSLGNPVANEDVTFTVIKGGGRVNGVASAVVTTDLDGRAFVLLTGGGAEGINSELIRASYPGSDPVHFVASDVIQGPPAATGVSGVVQTNENAPIANVLVKILDTDLQMLTDAEGRFSLVGAPVGRIHLVVDGTTAGPYPPLTFEIDLLTGVDNSMDRPIYLPTVDAQGVGVANPTTDLELRRDDTPGLLFTVPAGSVTFTGPAKTCDVNDDNHPCGLGCPCDNGVCAPNCGTVQVIRVHADKIPMPPPNKALPGIVLAIMPHDAHFDPPAPIRFPNVDGRPPGELVTIYSYNHDLGAFVGVGTAHVSEDGNEVISGPGEGIVQGGWHLVPPVPPVATDMGLGCEIYQCDCTGNCATFLGDPNSPLSCTQYGSQNQFNVPNATPTPDADCYTCPDDFSTPACQVQPTAGNPCTRYDAPAGECPAAGTATCIIPTVGNPGGNAVCCPDAQICTNPTGCPDTGTMCCQTACQAYPAGGVNTPDCCL